MLKILTCVANKLRGLLMKFIEADTVTHIITSSLIRLSLIAYGVFHDSHFEVPYTDIDYKVFTDAARHALKGNSPYERHTFRYSPLIAYLLTPNIYIHSIFGKIIFCEIDLVVAYLIQKLVYLNVIDWMTKFESLTSRTAPIDFKLTEKKGAKRKKGKSRLPRCNIKIETAVYWSHLAMLFWLYNPMTLAISTRGNSDSLSCFLVILTLYGIQSNWHPFHVGLIHGLAIHFRIYPIIYSFLYYLHYCSKAFYFYPLEELIPSKNVKKNKSSSKISKKSGSGDKDRKPKLFSSKILEYLIPNSNQVMLVLGTMSSLLGLTGLFYYLYGYQFLYESLIYHFVRVDFKHNFSLYFYLQYLTAFIKLPLWYTGNLWQPILINLPPMALLIHFSIRYGLNKFSLNFGVLAQTITFVIFNKVITSQYFVWIMGLLPLCIWQIKLSREGVILMVAIWFLAQAAWLLPAYLLEFKGEDTFIHIWFQGVSLFCAHIGILGRLIKSFILPLGEIKNRE
ncbi:GPI mannosyltransferase 1 [Euwallacea fornicatus]|uniref:GPI mannosyltransferase 1 n=1 Tax=Euwallacea fornicatus TaxID=995702 RepID=UPI00338D4F34